MRFNRRPACQRGATLILLTLALALVVIPLVGVAIDGTTLYLVKVKLSQAVDAAALGGTRSLSTGLDLASQTTSATNTALTYLYSNFPPGLMGAAYSGSPSITLTQNATVSRTMTVQATVTVPTTFLRVAGFASTNVSASGQATRRDVNLMLVLDRSGSMQYAGVCPTMIANAQNFVNRFSDGRDILGLVTFTDGASVDFTPTSLFKSGSPSLTSTLSNLQCGGDTSSAEGLWLAYQQIQAVNQPGRLNVIVFFTDGRPNGLVATYPIKTKADTRYTYNNPNYLSSSPASSCPAGTNLTGEIADWSGGSNTTGWTGGLMKPANAGIGSTATNLISGPGCSFPNSYGITPGVAMSSDVAYIPSTDSYGNSTSGYQTSYLFPTGNPYAGQIRPDTPPSIIAASTNAADDAAKRIRSDTKFNIVIYSLGLGGTSTQPMDMQFLQRVANDPTSPAYTTTQATGHFYWAADITQLGAAYEAIASQILRLSK